MVVAEEGGGGGGGRLWTAQSALDNTHSGPNSIPPLTRSRHPPASPEVVADDGDFAGRVSSRCMTQKGNHPIHFASRCLHILVGQRPATTQHYTSVAALVFITRAIASRLFHSPPRTEPKVKKNIHNSISNDGR
ncbi:hypothetical protein E2C01_048105 [Portunus trituberculatus]|uniref:Uncharacterized protein n=1 Tax=Portunus trituberculatus TaxID=210409 RepID=A0A5B7G9P8_PORTR|nr:hypothetical protein [Portunus trituberculatus]